MGYETNQWILRWRVKHCIDDLASDGERYIIPICGPAQEKAQHPKLVLDFWSWENGEGAG